MKTMQDNSDTARRTVQELLDVIESEGWLVTDYTAGVDPYEPPSVEIEAEFQGYE